ncbi:hypothetical protein [Rhodanobacter sp. DHB23]|uniref:hypothetical protein n=1 Tax=Rhodanobacter sp. DHB23 TaxID=2775923 RepID=UPI00177EC0E7|nr:hypothetical protein [Rhodanobacter sp. DHB23]MBD8872352.1 hypothetical protein [Rhodanobacter sp. DHB23]
MNRNQTSMLRNLLAIAICALVILTTTSANAKSNESKDLEATIAALATSQKFPQIGNIQVSLHVVFSDETTTGSGLATFYKAADNRWGITTIVMDSPSSLSHGMSITLNGSSCATAIGIAKFAGVTIKHNWALGVDGGPGYRAISARINDRRELRFGAASDHDCLTRIDLAEYPSTH